MIKNILLLLTLAMSALMQLQAQDTLIIHRKSGADYKYALKTIDSIWVSTGITVTDIDGNVYQVVKIGTQTWMAENLRTTHYSNGDAIPTTNPYEKDISSITNPKYQWEVKSDIDKVYGRFYTWYVATDTRNVCPFGWHVPSVAEWNSLSTFLGGELVAGGKLKHLGLKYWKSPNKGATNETGFLALPAGGRAGNGVVLTLGSWAYFWTSITYTASLAHIKQMENLNADLSAAMYEKNNGFPIRCIKD